MLGRLWSVCEVVLVHYVDAVVGVTVMRVLLFVLHVYMLRESQGAMVMDALVWGPVGGVVAVSVVCEYMGGTHSTRGSGFLYTADDVLEMCMLSGAGGVCEMCMCLARGAVGGVGVSG